MLREASKTARNVIQKTIQKTSLKMNVNEVNTIISLSSGTAEISGLSKAQINELLLFPKGVIALVHTLNRETAGVIFLTNADSLKAGDRATRTHRVLDIPVGKDNHLFHNLRCSHAAIPRKSRFLPVWCHYKVKREEKQVFCLL